MIRSEIAKGAFISQLQESKFKRSRLALHFVLPSQRESATALALLPHVLGRRCAHIPSARQLSQNLYALYGAQLSCESYTMGPARVLSIGITGLKNKYALNGQNLAQEYLNLLCNIVFAPLLEGGAFSAEDVRLEKGTQEEFLKGEMNDKRGYCLRQARRKLFGASALGVESAGYLEDINTIDEKTLYAQYRHMLCTAQVEVQVCGLDVQLVAARLAAELNAQKRSPAPLPVLPALPKASQLQSYTEAMSTTQGKLCIMLTSGKKASGPQDAALRIASAVYGGLPTSRLFVNVREKQSLCYYCASSYAYFSGSLCVDLGVDHEKAQQAGAAVMQQLQQLTQTPPTNGELSAAKLYIHSALCAAKDSPDALMNWAFSEWIKGTNRSIDEMLQQMQAVSARQVQNALAAFKPAVQYVITGKPEATL